MIFLLIIILILLLKITFHINIRGVLSFFTKELVYISKYNYTGLGFDLENLSDYVLPFSNHYYWINVNIQIINNEDAITFMPYILYINQINLTLMINTAFKLIINNS